MTIQQILLRALKTAIQTAVSLLPAEPVAQIFGKTLGLDVVKGAVIAGVAAGISVLWNAFMTWMQTWNTGDQSA